MIIILKSTSTRRRAGGIVFRNEAGQFQYLLVTSISHPERWVIPAGQIEPGEAAAAAALREVWEEAGVEAAIVTELGSLKHRWLRRHQWVELETMLFLMKLVRIINPEPEGRQVKFFTSAEITRLNLWEESREFLNWAQRLAEKEPVQSG